MTARLPALFPYLVLPLGIVLLQHHGVAYWQAALGSLAWGAFTSGTLEVFNLWAWFELERAPEARGGKETVWREAGGAKTGWFLFAGLTTAVLIAAPLYDVGRPLAAAGAKEELVAGRQETLGVEGERLTALALKRPGWRRVERKTYAERQKETTECLWISPSADRALAT